MNGITLEFLKLVFEIMTDQQLVESANGSKMVSDNVNSPAHYNHGGVECIEALKAATVGLQTGGERRCRNR